MFIGKNIRSNGAIDMNSLSYRWKEFKKKSLIDNYKYVKILIEFD